MTKKSWVVMTGLCVLLTTSSTQAHKITEVEKQSSAAYAQGCAPAARGCDALGNTQSTTVPEPETLALLMVGLVGAAITTRIRRRASK